MGRTSPRVITFTYSIVVSVALVLFPSRYYEGTRLSKPPPCEHGNVDLKPTGTLQWVSPCQDLTSGFIFFASVLVCSHLTRKVLPLYDYMPPMFGQPLSS